MFMGTYEHKFDSKGRIVVPSKFRQELGDNVVCTVGLDHCVALYSMSGWQEYLKKLQNLPFAKGNARSFTRAVLASADVVPIDAAGRVLISSFLQKYASLGETVTILGVNDHLEVWNSVSWASDRENILNELATLAEGVGELEI